MIVTLCLAMPASAGHLGVYGNTWEITEPDLLDALMAKLKTMEKAGKLKRLWQSPFTMHSEVVAAISREADNAAAGKPNSSSQSE